MKRKSLLGTLRIPAPRMAGQLKRNAFWMIGLLGTLGLLSEARAQTTSTWITETISAGGTIDWNTPAEWGGTAPAPGSVNLDFSGLTVTTSTLTLRDNITGTLDINQWTLGNATAAINYTRLSGADLVNLAKAGSTDPQIVHDGGANTQTISIGAMGITGTGAVLQITGTSTGLLSINSILSGGGINLNKSGGLQLTAAKTFSGDFTLTAGTLVVAGDSTGTADNVTSGPLGRGNLIINGGVLRPGSAAQRTILNSVQIGGDFAVGAAAASNKSITLAGTTLLTGTGVARTITGAFSGTAASDTNTLTFSGAISEEGANNGVVFNNSSVTKIVLSGVNTYTGDTTVNGGTLTLSDNGGLKFVIGANGVNNQLAGNGTVQLDGDFTFDLSGAGTALNDTWNIVDVGTLSATFGGTFTVVDFTDIGGNVWEKINAGTTYQFSEATGNLVVTAVPEPATWGLLTAGVLAAAVVRRRRRV